jgi:hypothetical protein
VTSSNKPATTCIGLDSGVVHTEFFSAAPARTPGIGSALICCSWPAGDQVLGL